MRGRFAVLSAVSLILATGGIVWCCFEFGARASAEEPATKKARNLRQPGFLFLELTVADFGENIAFFEAVAGYKVTHKESNFAVLQTEHGQLLLNGSNQKRDKPAGRIPGLEIGLVMGDLDEAHAAAVKFGWRITEGIMKRPWGVRDFRVLSPDGYYLRFTE